MKLTEVPVGVVPLERFREVVLDYSEVESGITRALEVLEGRTIWQVNSTAAGGGVAELLAAIGPYVRSVGIDFRWMVIEGDPEFFAITKRVHNNLHGDVGDGGELGEAEHEHYGGVLGENAVLLNELVRPGDLVMLHDPQTAGLVPAMALTGAHTLWRCHIGVDRPTAVVRRAWDFLRPYVADAGGYVFTRRGFVWEGLDPDRVWIVPPSIDAFSPKNQELEPKHLHAILAQIGLVHDGGTVPTFVKRDGTPGRVDRIAEIEQSAPLPEGAPVITQVSRWDRLKDHAGVLEAFALHVKNTEAHLVLCGPESGGVADDPEADSVLAKIKATRDRLDPATRDRVHIVCLPMDDLDENAAMVNAIQRRSTIVVQKSVAEGFGLTVGEAMWKGRAVIASRVGGIADQIVDGESGLLLDDPADLPALGAMIDRLLGDPALARRLGEAARERIRAEYLGVRHMLQYLEVFSIVLSRGDVSGSAGS